MKITNKILFFTISLSYLFYVSFCAKFLSLNSVFSPENFQHDKEKAMKEASRADERLDLTKSEVHLEEVKENKMRNETKQQDSKKNSGANCTESKHEYTNSNKTHNHSNKTHPHNNNSTQTNSSEIKTNKTKKHKNLNGNDNLLKNETTNSSTGKKPIESNHNLSNKTKDVQVSNKTNYTQHSNEIKNIQISNHTTHKDSNETKHGQVLNETKLNSKNSSSELSKAKLNKTVTIQSNHSNNFSQKASSNSSQISDNSNKNNTQHKNSSNNIPPSKSGIEKSSNLSPSKVAKSLPSAKSSVWSGAPSSGNSTQSNQFSENSKIIPLSSENITNSTDVYSINFDCPEGQKFDTLTGSCISVESSNVVYERMTTSKKTVSNNSNMISPTIVEKLTDNKNEVFQRKSS
jgi:hypothetical protein